MESTRKEMSRDADGPVSPQVAAAPSIPKPSGRTNNFSRSSDITRITLAVVFIGVLIAATFWIMRPFLLALIWATMIVVATWPIMLRLQAWLGGRRSLAVAIMTLGLLLVFIIPFSLAVGAIVNHADQIIGWAKKLQTYSLPPPPEWVEKLPVVGWKVSKGWEDISAVGPGGVRERLLPYTAEIVRWFVGTAGSFGIMLLEFLLTVIISAILFYRGETAARAVRRFAARLAGNRGEEAASLAGQTIRGVALGIVLTALIQAVLGGIGFFVTGIPVPVLLATVLFIFALAHLPSILIMGPPVIWLYWKGEPVWGTLLLVWAIGVGSIDNILRPILIHRGLNLPLLVIFAGVIGGLIAFGIIGLFIGPVVLAVAYRLLEAWVAAGESQPYPDSEDAV